MDNVLEIAKQNSINAYKDKDEYLDSLYNLIDSIILEASKYKDVTGIFLAQLNGYTTRVFQVLYREENSPVNNEFRYTHGCYSNLLVIDDNYASIRDIADHYAKLGFLSGIKVFEFKSFLQCRLLISWSDTENTDDKVNIHKYVNGIDIFASDSHNEPY